MRFDDRRLIVGIKQIATRLTSIWSPPLVGDAAGLQPGIGQSGHPHLLGISSENANSILRVRLQSYPVKTKVMVSGNITKDGLSKNEVDPCGVCSMRVKANSA